MNQFTGYSLMEISHTISHVIISHVKSICGIGIFTCEIFICEMYFTCEIFICEIDFTYNSTCENSTCEIKICGIGTLHM